MQHLFVYGTLAPGETNEHVLKDITGHWRYAHVRGKLYQSGWGAALGFPGIVLDVQADFVKGKLFSSSELEKHWDRLDEFEGEGYQRVLTSVYLKNDQDLKAYIYELNEKENDDL